jgi:hypothetical protein
MRNRKTDAERNIFYPLLLQSKSDIRVCNDLKDIKDAKKAARGFFTCAVSHPFDELATCSPLADAGAHDRHRMVVEVEKLSHRGWRSRAWAA